MNRYPDFFLDTADNEKEYAKRLFKFLEDGELEIFAVFPAGFIGNTNENLKVLDAGENYGWTKMYINLRKLPNRKAFKDIVNVFNSIAVAEKQHERRYLALLENIEKEKIFKKDKVVKWKCKNCGYIHEGKEASEECPACAHPKAYFELLGIKELKQLYKPLKPKIVKRLNEFKNVLERKSDPDLFAELVFCLLTPQSKAKNCWSAVLKLKESEMLFSGNKKQVQECLAGVRFKYKKAEYIVSVRKYFPKIKRIIIDYGQQTRNYELRQWLVINIKGFGYKEASHFLRNIGLGEDFAILDRHILKNLRSLDIIKKIPNSLTQKKYLETENKMRLFSEKVRIPISHLDLLFWSKETGEIFK